MSLIRRIRSIIGYWCLAWGVSIFTALLAEHGLEVSPEAALIIGSALIGIGAGLCAQEK